MYEAADGAGREMYEAADGAGLTSGGREGRGSPRDGAEAVEGVGVHVTADGRLAGVVLRHSCSTMSAMAWLCKPSTRMLASSLYRDMSRAD